MTRLQLDISALTLLKIFVAMILFGAIIKLYPLILLVTLSAMLAFALSPLVKWMEKKGLRRGYAQLLVVLTLLVLSGLFIFALLPELFSQVSSLAQKIGPLKEEAMKHLPEGSLRNYVGKSIEHPQVLFGSMPNYFERVGVIVFNSLWTVGIFLIVAIYFLVDGGRSYRWIIGFFTPPIQKKMNRTVSELEEIVAAYVGGQLITCTIVAIYVFALNEILGVPGALMLAVIAFIFDILPIIGFLSSTIINFLMALTVSPSAALTIVVLHATYQLCENYIIVPKVYGRKMKISTLVVLLSFLVAAPLAGIAGALLVLPFVASYPVIEKIWLRRYLGDEVIETHEQQLTEGQLNQNGLDIL